MPATDIPEAWNCAGRAERVAELRTLPPRVRMLLAAEWARSVLPVFEARHPGDDRPRKAIEAVERLAHESTEQNRSAADAAAALAADACTEANASYAAYAAAANAAYAAAANVAYAAAAANAAYTANGANAACAAVANASGADVRQMKWQWLYATFRHARGPGFAFRPEWHTGTAGALARGIVAERAFDRMPILADALQDAGCDDPRLIAHLQTDADEWTAADWCLCQLLGITD